MNAYRSVNPANGKILAEFPVIDDDSVRAMISRSYAAYRSWRAEPLLERTNLLQRVADLYVERRRDLAEIITAEMGKPTSQALGEVDLSGEIYAYYAAHAAEFMADEVLDVVAGGRAIVRTDAIGPLIGVMPWNYPAHHNAGCSWGLNPPVSSSDLAM